MVIAFVHYFLFQRMATSKMTSPVKPEAAPNALQSPLNVLKVIFGLSVAQVCLAVISIIWLAVIFANEFLYPSVMTMLTMILVTLVIMT